MITPELNNYVRQQLAAGTPKETVTKNLAQNGWSPQDIEEVFVNQKIKTPSFMGRKVFLSLGLVMASALYVFFQYVANPTPQQTPAIATSLPASQQNPPASSPAPDTSLPPATEPAQPQPGSTNTAVSPTHVATAPPPSTTPTPTPTPTPVSKPVGQYADGTYTGSAADAYYGTMQVQAIIQGGKIADVQFLQYPSDRNTSRYINGQAMPILKSEAIQVQSANVDIVSGATFSSQAFQQSLGSALAQAKN